MYRNLRNILISGIAGVVMVHCGSGQVKLQDHMVFNEKIAFKQDKARLAESAHRQLDKIYKLLKAHPEAKYEILCYVYSTSDSLSNSFLAGRRAKKVKKYFVRKGINYKRLVPRGYGNTRPVLNPNGGIDMEKSNRVEFKRLPLDTPGP
ncbi:OmpA family protein [Fibrobacterota bacterium]